MILPLLPEISVIVSLLTVLGLITIVGLDRVWEFRTEALDRFQTVFPYLALLGVVLAINSILRDVGPGVSWVVGWKIDHHIYAMEGNFVGTLQSYSHPLADAYFSYIYIYGYIFLLAFPVVAYFILANDRPVREITLAYALNYGIGVLCYTLFIAFGPRNVMPDTVDQVLYLHWPESNLLTSEVNANVNVFPSLHTSLAMTVAFLAIRTRDTFRMWVPISWLLAVSVVISTMYLGIHWGIDVIFGVALAAISVLLAAWLTSPDRKDGMLGRIGKRLRKPIDKAVAWAIARIRERRQTANAERKAEW